MIKRIVRKLKKIVLGPEPELPTTSDIPDQLNNLLYFAPSEKRSRFSVIMPTMWKRPDLTPRLIRQIAAADCVEEIIIIGNAPIPSSFSCEKVKILEQKANIYVNPAWNLGVEHSKKENLIIINDDLLISANMLEFMSTVDLGKVGLVGISKSSLAQIDREVEFTSAQKLKLSTRMNWGYGICMFVHKSHYFTIPSVLRIYQGDSFLYDTNRFRGTCNLTLETRIKTKMSSTSSLSVFKAIKDEDEKLWDNIYKKIVTDAAQAGASNG